MKQVLKFDEDLGDFMPFFCSVCNKMIGNNIIVKVGINYYKSPLCVDCNEARGVRVEGREEKVKKTRFNDALKTLLTTELEPRIKRIANKVNLTSKKKGRTKKDDLFKLFGSFLKEGGVDCFYNVRKTQKSVFIFRKLLGDKEYGLKAVLLLWEATGRHAGADSILYKVFPWIEKATTEDLCEDSIFTIEYWLIENYNGEMVSSFLNKELERRR